MEKIDQEELRDLIAKVHDDMEGRYDLDGYDLGLIQHYLCTLQKPIEPELKSTEWPKAYLGKRMQK